MGLDMYLVGKKIFGGRWSVNDHRMEDGLPVEKVELALGYWRKHHSLHNFIVTNFAYEGNDDCNPVELTVEQVNEIIEAIQRDELPIADGWTAEEHWKQKEEDLAILGKALAWITFDQDPPGIKPQWKSIYYQASW